MQSSAAWFRPEDKRTVLVAAGTTLVTWGGISLVQKLFNRLRPSTKPAHESTTTAPSAEQVQADTLTRLATLENTVTKLKNATLTQDASAAVFGLFWNYGLLDRKGNFTAAPGKQQVPKEEQVQQALHKIELITSIPARMETLEKTVQELNMHLQKQSLQLESLQSSQTTGPAKTSPEQKSDTPVK
ncbi:hypothetical protein [Methylicorpusculum sp.]|uniref:hypothetical protein n=1 Tax=Methylicorpusculum sp. TaxID=2713644 RepID=UPI002ABA6C5F|nr:hypothetical protein [Methylicorpusculum sp.]MDZ4154097.1 hypothetical protein [Methylicorpusculum sp.]